MERSQLRWFICQDVSWMPPGGCVSDMLSWNMPPRQTQDMLKRLYLFIGLRTPLCPPEGDGRGKSGPLWLDCCPCNLNLDNYLIMLLLILLTKSQPFMDTAFVPNDHNNHLFKTASLFLFFHFLSRTCSHTNFVCDVAEPKCRNGCILANEKKLRENKEAKVKINVWIIFCLFVS